MIDECKDILKLALEFKIHLIFAVRKMLILVSFKVSNELLTPPKFMHFYTEFISSFLF